MVATRSFLEQPRLARGGVAARRFARRSGGSGISRCHIVALGVRDHVRHRGARHGRCRDRRRGDRDGRDDWLPVAAVARRVIVLSAPVLVVVVRLYRARKWKRKWKEIESVIDMIQTEGKRK